MNNKYLAPIILTKNNVQNLLIQSGAPEEITSQIKESYLENFGDDLPLAKSLVDPKILKENEQRKKEKDLQQQVEILQTKLEQKANIDNEVISHYDVVLQVKPEKIPKIKSQIIDGQNISLFLFVKMNKLRLMERIIYTKIDIDKI